MIGLKHLLVTAFLLFGAAGAHAQSTTYPFYKAINLNGSAVTIDGLSYQAMSGSGITHNGSVLTSPVSTTIPETDSIRKEMLRTTIYRKGGITVNVPVATGAYRVYLYIYENFASQTSNIVIEGNIVQSNVSSGKVGSWKKLGPYDIQVSDTSLKIEAQNGKMKLSGIEIFRRVTSTTPTPTPTPAPTATPAPVTGWNPINRARVMLSGHSLMDNPLADYVEDIADKKGDNYDYNQHIIIGSPIRVRVRGNDNSGFEGFSEGKNRDGYNLNIASELKTPRTLGTNEKYDTLVITERHDSLSSIRWENTDAYTRHYVDRALAGNVNTRSFLYHSWWYLNKSSPAAWIQHEKNSLVTWECVASKVNETYKAENNAHRMKVLPAGAALVDLVERAIAGSVPGITGTTAQKMNMIFADDVHLTNLGSYFISLVTYSSIMGKTAAGVTPPAGISAATASSFQSIAWNYVNAYYNRANPGVRTMAYCRDFMRTNSCATYNSITGENDTAGCQSFFGSTTESPFRWPDSSFVKIPVQ